MDISIRTWSKSLLENFIEYISTSVFYMMDFLYNDQSCHDFVTSFSLRAPIQNSTLSHQVALKKLLLHEIKIRLPWLKKDWYPSEMCIYATMGNKALSKWKIFQIFRAFSWGNLIDWTHWSLTSDNNNRILNTPYWGGYYPLYLVRARWPLVDWWSSPYYECVLVKDHDMVRNWYIVIYSTGSTERIR